MRRAAALMLFALAACSAAPDVTKTIVPVAALPPDLPPARGFAPTRTEPPARSNAEIAADFLELEFRLESGRGLPRLTRFTEPVTIALSGDVPATAAADLTALIDRLQSEAGLDVRQTSGPASITLNFLARRAIRGSDPNVACFVVPGVSTWAEYQSARGSSRLDWAMLPNRDRIAVFIPGDASPQEVRDCLHEEVAQSLGPLNDLYRLSDSVFNDDNFHTVLTGFDMLMLRLHYAPELANGMTEAEVAARLPALLARLNPAGERPAGPRATPTPEAWSKALETALGPRGSAEARRRAAQNAVALAQNAGWTDSRLAFSYFALGRVNLGANPSASVAAFDKAALIYRSLPGGRIHAAHVDMQLAAFALSRGRSDVAIALADDAIPVVRAAENAALLASFMLIKAEALEIQGRTDEAATLRRESLGWARYGFGTGNDLAKRISAIAALVPAEFRG